MSNYSPARRVTFDIPIPDSLVLLEDGAKLECGDFWYNFHTLEWDLVDTDFLGLPAQTYLAARHKAYIRNEELPEALRR